MHHGDYLQIIILPSQCCEVPTRILLENSQRMDATDFWGLYYSLTSSSEASDSHFSPWLVNSEKYAGNLAPEPTLMPMQVIGDG